MKKLLITLIALLFCTASANAIPLFLGETNHLSDNSAEYLINADGSTADGGDSIVEVGDRLRGWFDIGTIEDLSGGGGTRNMSDYPNEITGFFDIVVTSIDATTGVFTMGAYSGFATEIEALYGLSAGSAAGSMVAFLEDPAFDYSRINDGSDDIADADEEALLATATGGDLLWTFGDTGAGESWTVLSLVSILTGGAFAFDDVAGFELISTSTSGGIANFNLTNIVNNTSIIFDTPAGSFDAVGTGNLLGVQGADTPADSWNNFDFTIHAAVPEPTTILLLGSGLLALAGIGRRKSM